MITVNICKMTREEYFTECPKGRIKLPDGTDVRVLLPNPMTMSVDEVVEIDGRKWGIKHSKPTAFPID